MTTPTSVRKRAADAAAPAPGPTGRRPERGARWRRVGLRLVALAALLALWQLVIVLQLWSPVLVPSPAAVWRALLETSGTHDGVRGYSGHLLIEHLGVSLRRIFIGSADRRRRRPRPRRAAWARCRWLRVVAEPRRHLRAGAAAAGLLQPAHHLVRHRRDARSCGCSPSPRCRRSPWPPPPPCTSRRPRLVEAARALGARRVAGHPRTWCCPAPCRRSSPASGSPSASRTPRWSPPRPSTGVPGIGGMIRDAQRYTQTDVVVLGLFAIGLSGLLIDALLRILPRTGSIPWRGTRLTSPPPFASTSDEGNHMAGHAVAPPLLDRRRSRSPAGGDGLRRRRRQRRRQDPATRRSASPTRRSPAAT